MPRLRTELRRFRQERGMRQEELAELVGVRRETVLRLEKGLYNPSLRLAMDVAKVFGVSVEEMFSFEE
ncbi:MAG: helix-turn-helix transcriptional regulator [Coriobacteriales bacterium]|jgi:putative transcriptional regulator|nr:helix-turn-helix transcriptional regulator [Coriobacteriales bacterium]